jgi:hypothetical protein
MKTAEHQRLEETRRGSKKWRQWGPYLSERQWGTVREDYSADGSAWDHFPHEHARSRAYRWGEDGLAGFSDDQQLLCFSVALWNGKDAILKERMFGLTGPEGNHGEDVKELYWYLDATPTGSYLKHLYKYPQQAFPYARLVEENRRRDKHEAEFELLDTGVFDADRYFDIVTEYAKSDADDVLIRISATNRGDDAATIHLLPQLFFRNTWSWSGSATRPETFVRDAHTLELRHPTLGTYFLHFEDEPELLFTENDTNAPKLWNAPNAEGRYYKDAFHDYLVANHHGAVNPQRRGTKVALHIACALASGATRRIRLRLTRNPNPGAFTDFDTIFSTRIDEADDFYAHVQRDLHDADARHVQRLAFAGLIWSRQFYYLDIPQWLTGDPAQPKPPSSRGRNRGWEHLNNADVITMPDKWEYPYYCVWDTALQCCALAQIDPEWAKHELVLVTREWYMHPNGQLPAYEWAYGDVNPPVHAWAAWRVYQIDRDNNGRRCDRAFLERVFHKLLLNFTWWVNRKDLTGRNIFQGGFLGLDNIGVFDRSATLPTGGHINQADGTSWMATYALNMMRIALELARENPTYQDLATKFFEHFLHIAEAMTSMGATGVDLWDPADEFFYDVLCLPDGSNCSLKVRSMVGLLPLMAVEVLDPELLASVPEFAQRLEWFLNYRPDLAKLVSRWQDPGKGETRLLSLLRGHRMKALLRRMLDETEFLSSHGLRALSRHHLDHPYVYNANSMDFSVRYQAAESDSGLFGGNSNWRGPVWMPVNFLIIESLRKFHSYYGDDFQVECPTGSGNFMTIAQVADELSRRLSDLFLRDQNGRRPVLAYHEKLQSDPHFRDHVLFHEYFDGETGRGVGASHQTGWTALVASLLMTNTNARHTHDHQQQKRSRNHAGGAPGHSHAAV